METPFQPCEDKKEDGEVNHLVRVDEKDYDGAIDHLVAVGEKDVDIR